MYSTITFKYSNTEITIMFKWLWSLMGFLLLATAISALTLNVFITAVNDDFDNINTIAREKSQVYAEETYSSFMDQMNPQARQQIAAFELMLKDQKRIVLTAYCADESKKEELFCNPKYISGELNFEQVLKEKVKTEFEQTMTTALTEFKNQLSRFTAVPLIPVAIITSILSIFFYFLARGFFGGLQKFFSSAAWLSFLSAISFKTMKGFFEKILTSKLVEAAQQQGAGAEKLALLLKDILMQWLSGAMDKSFIVCLMLAGIALVLWLAIKLYRKYNFFED